MPTDFVTKDSGKRQHYDSGMNRDVEDGKTDFTYLIIPGVPYEDQPIHRIMELYMRGAEKYGRNNWQKANSKEEMERFKRSLFRHWMQYLSGDRDEDHIAAVVWNAICVMYMEAKLDTLSTLEVSSTEEAWRDYLDQATLDEYWNDGYEVGYMEGHEDFIYE